MNSLKAKNPFEPMKTSKTIAMACLMAVCILWMPSCALWNKAFGPKYGCKSNGKNVGAERLFTGEKLPKAKKFRS